MVRRSCSLLLLAVVATTLVLTVEPVETAQQSGVARISEELRSIKTYAFSEPNPVPILVKDTRLYPYHSFEGYEQEGTPRDWKVVHLENDLIELWVLPEIGGKVWGARVKKTGHEFIYRNEVIKFRNIALRGPWTSGGIEFNFGVIGHAPSTASPVDYVLKTNVDGSVSCIVGTMDLPSRTQWRVEIRLPADRASFETNVLWHNPTALEQPYYNWMTAAAVATNDLEVSIPGNAYLQHSGQKESWPNDEQGRFLPIYGNNQFGGNKSFHVVGELQDFFGGYYSDTNRGFGHWARHEDMPGQKLWLWALSRAGGIWEDLLTDTDGQYVEFQAGRLLVQYSAGDPVNPITQAGFDPLATDRWTETWFPLEGIGGLTDASSLGAMAVREVGDRLEIGVNAFARTEDTLRVWSEGRLVSEQPVSLVPLEPFTASVDHTHGTSFRVELPGLGLDYSSDPASREVARPFESDPAARPAMPAADRLVFDGRELVKARRYDVARPLFEEALALTPWHRGALLALADLEYRRARYDEGLTLVTRALKLDAYDAAANFQAGNLYHATGRVTDAREAFGWAARSLAYRSAANVQLADLALARRDWAEAARYAQTALDYNRNNLTALEILAIVGRKTADGPMMISGVAGINGLDPLQHFVRAEAFLAAPTESRSADLRSAALINGLRSEYPEQVILELAIAYANRGLNDDAVKVLDAAGGPGNRRASPLIEAWSAYLKQSRSLARPSDLSFVFPYRRETLPVLAWAAEQDDHWSWKYLLALNLWAVDRAAEAQALLQPLGNTPDWPAFYVSRAFLNETLGTSDPESDLRQAERLGGSERAARIPLISYYQKQARWADALAASSRARETFPGDFNLDLLHVRSLVNLGRGSEAIQILDTIQVLPSEHARESHQLYVQAHVLAAVAALEAGRNDGNDGNDEAYQHLEAALEWPERLGQGRPYEPEEGVVRFLMSRVDERRGRSTEARPMFKSVLASTTNAAVREMVEVLARPGMANVDARKAAIDGVVAKHERFFGDLDGKLFLRALSLTGR